MNEKNLSDNPNLKQIDEKKLILIESLVAQAQQKKPEEILPFFLACARQAGNHPATAHVGRFAQFIFTCFTRSFTSARLALLNRSTVPTR